MESHHFKMISKYSEIEAIGFLCVFQILLNIFTECLPYAAAAAAAAARCMLGSSFKSFASRNTTALMTPVLYTENKYVMRVVMQWEWFCL